MYRHDQAGAGPLFQRQHERPEALRVRKRYGAVEKYLFKIRAHQQLEKADQAGQLA